MRIAARWIGWYSLAAAAAALLALVVSVCATLWLEPPRRVTACGRDIDDLVRALDHACAQHNAPACRRLDTVLQRVPALRAAGSFEGGSRTDYERAEVRRIIDDARAAAARALGVSHP